MTKITDKIVLENKEIVFSAGELAQQADGAVVVESGGTLVLVTVCYAKEGSLEKDFLPLTVEYQEKTYAAGRIPGGFLKRDGRPKDAEILCARLIDRPLRPLFDYRLRHEIQIVAEVLSSDAENDPDVLAVNAAAMAIAQAGLPLLDVVACVRIIRTESGFIINPTYAERESAVLDLVVAATPTKIVMLEGGASKVSNEIVSEAVKLAHVQIKKLIEAQQKFVARIQKKPSCVFTFDSIDEAWSKKVEDAYLPKIVAMVRGLLSKEEFRKEEQNVKKSIVENTALNAGLPEGTNIAQLASKIIAAMEEKVVRERIIKEKVRADGRGLDALRDITCKVSFLPRTHGSAIFKRGQTQSLAVTTLGSTSEGQIIESLSGRGTKKFMLHYAFPPFSVGEVKPMRGVSRREIGHGALAEKSLLYVLPSTEEFTYTIRVVSEILESNGSSSMATVCASSLSLMDAGVPIKEAVAGVAMGLIKEGQQHAVLTDIAGIEDHCGDMDFKIAGVRDGITAIQLDVKNEGLDYALIDETLQKSKIARCSILDKMQAAITSPRTELSPYAPKIKSIKINVNKIGELIGPGGKNIRKISSEYNVQIDIDDENALVSVVATNDTDLKEAVQYIVDLTKDIEVGEVYDGRVVKLMNFGAFCELLPGKSGLLHISEIADGFVKNVSDHLKDGDIVRVKVKEIDDSGRINLTRKGLDK